MLLDRLACAPPARPALRDEHRSVSYAELQSLVQTEAAWLLASGGRRFALLADNGCGWAICDLALHRAGCPNIPLPSFFTDAQLDHVLTQADVDCVLTDRSDWVRERWPQFTAWSVSGCSGLSLLRRPANKETYARVPQDTLKVTYTSGSTAQPKGVCLSARALEQVAHSLAAATAPLAIASHLCLLPLSTLLENIAGIYAPLLAGATCVLPANRSTGIHYRGVDAQRMLDSIATAQPESLILVPELLQLLVAAVERGWKAPATLKFIAVGGASVSPQLLERAALLELPVYQGYGLSECGSVVCLNTPSANRPGSVGRALPHARIRCDERGEIMVRGALMSAYLGETPESASTAALRGEIATGDLGEIDADGFLYIKGRLRNLSITSLGRNISPEWIERELAQEAGVRQAFAFGEARPYAIALLAAAGPHVTPALLDQAVTRANARLPDYARVRRWALFPEAPSFDSGLLTANGRLRRDRVIERFGELIHGLYERSIPTHENVA